MRLSIILVLALGFALFASCSGGGGGGGAAPAGAVGLVTGDAPTDGLSSFSVTVVSVTFTTPTGVQTGNLLTAPRTFDYLDLEDQQAYLALVQVPVGTFELATLTVNPLTIEARDTTGAMVPISVVSASASDDFSGPGSSDLVIVQGAFQPVSLEILLDNSLDDDPAVPGGLLFDPRISARSEISSVELDEFKGDVVSVDPASSSFDLLISCDESPAANFGMVTVAVEDTDFLVDQAGVPFTTAAGFLAALVPGMEVEADGVLQLDGTVDASSARIDDPSILVEIEGTIMSVNPGAGTFEFIVRELEKGLLTAQPVLAGLGNPDTITVSFTPSTPIHNHHTGQVLTAASLVPGLRADVRFNQFAAPMPFAAGRIEVEDTETQFHGTITGVSGLSNSVEVTLSPEDFSVQTGLVTAPVTLDLSNLLPGVLILRSCPNPVLDPSDLLLGMSLRAKGTLSGSPGAATVTPSEVKINAGRLDGQVLAVDSASATMTVSVTGVRDPFGGTPPTGTIQVSVDPSACLFLGTLAATLSEVEIAFNAMIAPVMMEIELDGIAAPGGLITAHELHAETVTPSP